MLELAISSPPIERASDVAVVNALLKYGVDPFTVRYQPSGPTIAAAQRGSMPLVLLHTTTGATTPWSRTRVRNLYRLLIPYALCPGDSLWLLRRTVEGRARSSWIGSVTSFFGLFREKPAPKRARDELAAFIHTFPWSSARSMDLDLEALFGFASCLLQLVQPAAAQEAVADKLVQAQRHLELLPDDNNDAPASAHVLRDSVAYASLLDSTSPPWGRARLETLHAQLAAIKHPAAGLLRSALGNKDESEEEEKATDVSIETVKAESLALINTFPWEAAPGLGLDWESFPRFVRVLARTLTGDELTRAQADEAFSKASQLVERSETDSAGVRAAGL